MKYWRNTCIEDLQEEYEGILYIEEWKDIYGYNGKYQVSTFGRVKSFVVSLKGRIRKGVPALGYPQLQLKGNGDNTMETSKIHRLVAQAFIPNPYNLPEVNHIKGDRGDCRVWMLEWSTASDNIKHAYRVLGKKNNLENQKGETHYNTTFKISDILNIRQLFKEGKTTKEIANEYSKSTSLIGRIVRRERWKHI